MMVVNEKTTVQEFLNNGGDITEFLPKNVTRVKINIKAKDSDIVVVGEPQVDLDLDVDNCSVTIVDSEEAERVNKLWDKLFREQAERHAKWNK